jgi:hypothetical protein
MADHVFPQHGDFPDAASIAQLIGHESITNYVDDGLDITVDYGKPDVDVSSGKAYIKVDSYQTETPQIDPKESRDGVGFVVEFEGATEVPLFEDDINNVYLNPNIGTDDSPEIEVTGVINGGTPGPNSFPIARITTLGNRKVPINRASDGVQSAPREIEVRTSDGTFKPPEKAKRIYIRLIGAGGGGGSTSVGGGGGGGAAGNVHTAIVGEETAIEYDIVVGSGGSGGSGGSAGSDGGDTKVIGGDGSPEFIARGGKGGGSGSSPDGGGPSPLSSKINLGQFGSKIKTRGDSGGAGTPQESGARATSGKGGDSMYGGGGAGKAIGSGSTSTKAGADGNGYGGGGSGAAVGGGASSGTTATGGDGADGAVIFMW